jgi:hypothetical protein
MARVLADLRDNAFKPLGALSAVAPRGVAQWTSRECGSLVAPGPAEVPKSSAKIAQVADALHVKTVLHTVVVRPTDSRFIQSF